MRLDFGCGPNKREGFLGVDSIAFPGVDVVMNIAGEPWPWEDASVDEAHASHFVEHLNAWQRVYFFNQLYRVLKPGAQASIIVPHWASTRAYGDPTHQWPPFSEFALFYLDKGWRAANAPHTDSEHDLNGFECDFSATWGYGMHPSLMARNQEFQQFALNNYKEAASDLHATLTRK